MAYSRPPAPDDLLPLEVFGNSARFLYDEEALTGPAEAARWLRERDLLPQGSVLGDGEVERLVRFRETLRDHLDDRADAATVAALNAYCEETLTGAGWAADGTPTLFPATDRGADGLIARLLALTHRADATGELRRLKPCRAPECRWLFYDRSPGGNSVWCSMDICGARHKMRTHRSRRHEG
ncbi:Conserved protein containing a Zn-ribbon-like motif, possibly RNA-binding [Amycolatopsis marina]|uniref:Conserved protein containing a Zn-ribbon-like motif, possibly RNA-binding n=1 Tax=Amycolatopsis marina TaxID=490629 RepID=A0A1I0ZBB7_9PSEU|nr:CGNR zinc finger domain-containing protein [Amycolatopsis marina]SFB21708.1 Conserved protein containing a Zn-ribbon-like motif, possibly RNA-binding [Amycolatopsis marina]